ncbi:Ltp family lipoprotein [Corynebacterium aquatimens]|uniref:Putative host cell surface-exposed lipoprotein Ltp-like HTH region domain-containing protein n=1 Tax=Corynebacterium aquatimens TaxID=1190508 RepID=A0A931E076_9CORY|nr:Ltp family lipoprotein [Corynebacterium aquatimens]MBG6121341.1 hypothetical protein [Corynebacterium aquatimens]WJY66112.1 Host cell surface-exposed lipoprotein [Corynebacterium aquatimens]
MSSPYDPNNPTPGNNQSGQGWGPQAPFGQEQGGWSQPDPNASWESLQQVPSVGPSEWGQPANGPGSNFAQQGGQAQFGQQQFGQPQNGQPQYGQGSSGQPPYGEQPPTEQGGGKGRMWAIIIGIAVLVTVAIVALALVLGGDKDKNSEGTASSEEKITPTTSETGGAPSEEPAKSSDSKSEKSGDKDRGQGSAKDSKKEPTSGAKPKDGNVPADHKKALEEAERYLAVIPFSYEGLYDQLISEYGAQASPEAARYAVDNVDADWNEQALRAAEQYVKVLDMSDEELFDQLTHDFGGKFTPEQARYAIEHLDRSKLKP